MADQYIVFDTVADRSDGTLPDFSGGLAVQEIFMSQPPGNAPVIKSGGATLLPTTTQTQGWYGQFSPGGSQKITKIGFEFMWTENKPVGNSQSCPTLAFYPTPLSVASPTTINTPATAGGHHGVSRTAWQLQAGTPGFFGYPTIANGNYPALGINIPYPFVVEYVAADTIKVTLPDGTVKKVQNSAFANGGQSWGFFEPWLGVGTSESNLKFTSVVMGTDQWYPNNLTPSSARPATPPPSVTVATYYEAYCRNEAVVISTDVMDNLNDDTVYIAAKAHVSANPGHVVQINQVVR